MPIGNRIATKGSGYSNINSTKRFYYVTVTPKNNLYSTYIHYILIQLRVDTLDTNTNGVFENTNGVFGCKFSSKSSDASPGILYSHHLLVAFLLPNSHCLRMVVPVLCSHREKAVKDFNKRYPYLISLDYEALSVRTEAFNL